MSVTHLIISSPSSWMNLQRMRVEFVLKTEFSVKVIFLGVVCRGFEFFLGGYARFFYLAIGRRVFGGYSGKWVIETVLSEECGEFNDSSWITVPSKWSILMPSTFAVKTSVLTVGWCPSHQSWFSKIKMRSSFTVFFFWVYQSHSVTLACVDRDSRQSRLGLTY